MVWCCFFAKNAYLCIRVSHIRPAPAELPQGRKAARVCGCSGAIYSAYPFFVPIRLPPALQFSGQKKGGISGRDAVFPTRGQKKGLFSGRYLILLFPVN